MTYSAGTVAGQSLGCGHEAHDRYDRYRYYNYSSPILVFHEIFSFPCRGLLLGLDDSPHAGMGADDGLDLDLVLFQLCRYLPMPHTWLSSHQSFTEEDESERSPAKSDPFEGEQLPFPFAPERACFRKVGRCRSLQQRQPPPGSCLAVQPSPQSGRCGWCRHQTGQNERNLPDPTATGKVGSCDLVDQAANVVAVAKKSPVIRSEKL